MDKFILGKKIGMTTIYQESKALNVTLVACESKVSEIRTKEKNGYDSVQLETKKTEKKPMKKEFKVFGTELKKGDIINVSIFSEGDKVTVSGVTKAKGFQGGVKRHGFKGSPASHGHKHDLRAPGSIGAGFPEHVIKGKRMAGRMGGERSAVRNLKVVYIDKEKNIIGLKGPVPGIPGNIVEIRSI
jgi:large subunit ribosomal protein L3